ncbi:hypothetical protein CCUG60885_04287 [Mycobacteroides salmoniphilum]|uniref:Peptidase M15C domain-containing protein n=1 Tax=Mycobacteroides salmoniphilum TaxID=404941 RepID=A0A4R8SC50_9MYCO|nr:hypothetical protein CCUG60885_04287 [Mycobacteroides salmoniphilum]TEA07402.1 hypothetical protein CCUG60883_01435 [Mycobacteroides salmoniphilum]
MARRLFNGNRFSENGWPYVDEGSCTWVKVPGADVSLQIQNGPPLALLRAWAADWNAYIEPLRDADSACWTPGNSVATSNHPGGTAIDLNWESHPFQERGSLNAAQMAVMAEMEGFYEGNIFWAGRWGSPVDEMHSQVGYDTYDQQADAPKPSVFNFIARKIRADGYSTFRRGNKPLGAVPVLAAATGLSEARAAEILPAVSDGLKASQCTSVNRIAMWLAHVGHESVSFKYTEEIAKNGRYAPYIGRTWIQITWDYNYRAFSQWCFERAMVPTSDYFVVNYRELADLKWAGIGASWYWTEQRPMNDLIDAGEGACWGDYSGFAAVTAAINGGTNGLADRRDRYNRALLQGDALLSLVAPTETPDPIEELLMSDLQVESLSIYATPGEPLIPIVRMVQAIDAAEHRKLVEDWARNGDTDALSRIARTAAGQGKFRDAATVAHAQAVLADIEATNPAALQQFISQKGQS